MATASGAERPACLDKALELLALRSHFTAELERKLRQRGYEAQEISAAISTLTADAVLDDQRTAREFVEVRRRRRGEGPQRIRHELLRRGVDAQLAEEVSSDESTEESYERALELARRRAERGAEEPAIGRFLARKGYAKRVILMVFEELRRET